MNNFQLEKLFPNIKGTNYTIINNTKTNLYNCIAFSVDDNTKWWWPIGIKPYVYWPTNENDNSKLY